MNKTKTFGLTHLAVRVKDLQKTKAFYQSVFEMEVMYDEPDFLQLTTPGAHDIIVFEKTTTATGNTGSIVHFGFPAPGPRRHRRHGEKDTPGRRCDYKPG